MPLFGASLQAKTENWTLLKTKGKGQQQRFCIVRTQKWKRFKSRLSSWIEEWITNWWGVELMFWLFAALSIIAILITLAVHNGRPLPDWPLGITINAVISILATMGQMSMMNPVTECISQLKWLWFTRRRPLQEFQAFDSASRGTMGSLKLLWKLRGLHIVSVGAALTMVSLAFGPFTQQVLTYPSRPREISGATTPRVQTLFGNSTSFHCCHG